MEQFVPGPFWLIYCQQDYIKTTEHISMKLRSSVGVGPEYSLLTFDLELDSCLCEKDIG